MIFTARQLEELHRSGGGQITLPYRARLTPLAQDWVRQHGVKIGYTDMESPARTVADSPVAAPQLKWMWWADGPCGPAKAALATVARESNFQAAEIGVDSKRI